MIPWGRGCVVILGGIYGKCIHNPVPRCHQPCLLDTSFGNLVSETQMNLLLMEDSMKHIVVDLEMNKTNTNHAMHRMCSTETIEIGAVMLDEEYREIASFRTYIKPEYNDKITKKVSELTGITYDMVKNAPTFEEAINMFANWCVGANDEITIYAWSDNDYRQITMELMAKGCVMTEAISQIVEKEWTDFQHKFDTNLGFERQISLSAALDMAGLDFQGREHDALDDAKNTAELLHTFADEDLFKKTLSKVADAMTPASLGNTLGSLFDFSAFSFG